MVDVYTIGDREERRRKEQQALNEKGGKSQTDNKRDEIRESKWGEKGVKHRHDQNLQNQRQTEITGETVMNERPIPPAAKRDKNSVELLRVWVAEHNLHCSLKIGMYREMDIPEEVAWGTILADAARHIAKALAEHSADSESVLLGKLQVQLIAELDKPSSAAKGSFVDS